MTNEKTTYPPECPAFLVTAQNPWFKVGTVGTGALCKGGGLFLQGDRTDNVDPTGFLGGWYVDYSWVRPLTRSARQMLGLSDQSAFAAG